MRDERNPIELETERLRAERDRDEVQLRLEWVRALSILFGMLMVLSAIVAVLWAWADSDLTDALQECGRILLGPESGPPSATSSMKNESVDACRRMVFDYYGGLGK